MAKGKAGGNGNGGEVHDLTVKILPKIHGGIAKLVEGQNEMRVDLRGVHTEFRAVNQRLDKIDGRLASVLDYTLHRYEDHEKRLRAVEDKLLGR